MQHRLSQHTLYQLSILGLASILTLTACHKKTETTDNAAAASVAASQAVPMSAAPADEKNTAAINAANATVDAGPEMASNASATADAAPASGVEVEASGEGEADNSGMDKITENDQVIDNEPASPNAPKASDSPAPAVGNQKVGQ